MKMKITKDSIIGDILDADGGTAVFFFEMGMHCLGCPASRGESVEEACAVHGVDVDALGKKLKLDDTSVVGLIATLANSIATMESADRMNRFMQKVKA